jgi:O-antigen ligase
VGVAPDLLLLFIAYLIAASAVVALFAHWERSGLSHVPAAIILGLLTFESILLPAPGNTPNGLFRFRGAGEDVRTIGALTVLALVARWWARGFPTRVSRTGLLWAACGFWYCAAAWIGVTRGHDSELVKFEFQSLLYIAAGYLLFAGTPVRALLSRRAVGWWTGVLSALIGVVAFTTLFELYSDVSLGLQTFPGLGSYGPSGRSVVSGIAVVTVVSEACRARPRNWVIICALLLLLSPVVGIQRASLVQALLCFGGLLIIAFGRTWRRRATVTPTLSGLVVLGLIGVVVAIVVIPPAVTGEQSIVMRSLDRAFTGEGQAASAEARQLLWSESRDLIEEHPIAGWGLGKRTALARPFPLDPMEMSSHNILLDLWIRAGLVSVLLFLGALAASFWDATRTWRRHPDPIVGAYAIGCAIALVGLIGKGLVEPLFDNFRLATLLGMLAGGIASAANSRTEVTSSRTEPERTPMAAPVA